MPSVSALPELVRTSLRIAISPRPGPVALIIPHDIFDADWDADKLPPLVDDLRTRMPYLRSVAPAADIARAAALIRKARRPALVCGGGVHGADAAVVVTAFADRLGGLVVTSLSGKGSAPETRDYAAGVLNPLGSKAAIDLIGEADLVIWCGSKVSQNTGMNWTLPKAEQATITIDFDPLEHGRTFRPTVPLLGDVRETVAALDLALGDSMADARPDWAARIAEVKAEWDAVKAGETNSPQIPILPPRIMAEIDKRLSDKDVVVSDASFAAGWIGRLHPGPATGPEIPVRPRAGRAGIFGTGRDRRRDSAAGGRPHRHGRGRRCYFLHDRRTGHSGAIQAADCQCRDQQWKIGLDSFLAGDFLQEHLVLRTGNTKRRPGLRGRGAGLGA